MLMPNIFLYSISYVLLYSLVFIAEGDETIIIQLNTPTGGGEIITGVVSSVTVQIEDNDNGGGIISFPIRKVGSAGQALVTRVLTGYNVVQEFSYTSGTALFEDGLDNTYIYLLPINDAVQKHLRSAVC